MTALQKRIRVEYSSGYRSYSIGGKVMRNFRNPGILALIMILAMMTFTACGSSQPAAEEPAPVEDPEESGYTRHILF